MSVSKVEIHKYENIHGLELFPDFISSEIEKLLLENIEKNIVPHTPLNDTNSAMWMKYFGRDVCHFGYIYDYKTRTLAGATEQIPEWLNCVIEKMISANIIMATPEQCIVNKYLPGQGIASHTDAAVFGEPIISLSLGSQCTMVFRHNNHGTRSVILPRRSLLVLRGEARSQWKHEIPARLKDDGIPRTTRISVTFRYVVKKNSN